MGLEMDDSIYIKGFKDEHPDFYCWKHMKDLIGFPTKVFLIRNDIIYVTHPILDLVPFSENCVDYELLEDVDLGYHKNLKNELSLMKNFGMDKLPITKVRNLFKKKINEQEQDKNLNQKDQSILDLINDINNGDIDENFINNFFGGFDNFFKLINRKGWLNLIDPFSRAVEDIQNLLFYEFYKINNDFIYEIVKEYLSDIEYDGTDYYFLADHDDLSELFNVSRGDISEKTISKIISGEYDVWEYGTHYDADNEYQDVYKDLDHNSKSLVDEYIVNELEAMKTLKWTKYKRPPEILEDIAKEQGKENEIDLTDEIIIRIMTDDDCLEYLINKEMDDVRINLSNTYSSCYADCLVSEWYNDLWSEIEGEIVDSREAKDYSYNKETWDKEGKRITKTFYAQKYKVTNCIYEVIKSWLETNKDNNGYNNNTIYYFGSYINLLKDSMEYGPMDRLRVPRLDDYPDWRKLEKCINDNIESYF